MSKIQKNKIVTPRKYKLVDENSENDSDMYKNALMSSLIAMSKKDNSDMADDKKPTESRIEFIKNILDGNKLKPMINFDNCDTESSINSRLNKKIMDIKELVTSMNVKLKYLKSGTTGHTFKAVSIKNTDIAFAVKVCAYPKDEYGCMTNLYRPENAELRMLKLLSYFVIKRCTPHFVLPIGTFNTSITNFIRVPKEVIDLDDSKNEMYKKFIERYNDGEFEDFVSVLISEWCNGGDLLDYIRKNHMTMTLESWVVIIFQILYTLALVHEKYPSFRHNDMKANNILIQLTDVKRNSQDSGWYRYHLEETKFIIPDIKIQIKIWDFDFACIDNIIENNKVNADWTKKINISKKENKYYDMHYFLNTLISHRFFPQFYNGGAPQEIIDFVHRIVPPKFRNGGKYVNKKGRIQIDVEYTTPHKVIMTDPLFALYRIKEKKSKT